MLRKRIVYGRPNAATSSFSPLQPCVLNSDLKYFNLSISHLEVTHIPKIVILAYFLKSYRQKKRPKKTEVESIAPSVSPTVTAGANKQTYPTRVTEKTQRLINHIIACEVLKSGISDHNMTFAVYSSDIKCNRSTGND